MGRWWPLVVVSFVACDKPAPVPVAPPRNVVATWDGGVVTAAEVKAAVRQLGPGLREQFDTPVGRDQFVDALVAKRLLAAEARHRGLDKQEDLRTQVDELEERLLIQALLADDARTQKPPEEATLRAYYTEHLQTFLQPAAVRVSRVLIRKEAKPAAAKDRVERLRQRVVRGEKIEKVATEGEGAERLTGGDIGWLDTPTTPLARAALALTRPHEVSPVVELEDAFAFVTLTERREERTPPFEEVKEVVASRYAPIAQRLLFDRLVKKLFTESNVKLNTAGIQ